MHHKIAAYMLLIGWFLVWIDLLRTNCAQGLCIVIIRCIVILRGKSFSW